MVTPTAFDHIAIKADDVSDMRTFYESTLDATVFAEGVLERDSWDESFEYVGVNTGGLDVYLLEKTPYEAEGVVESLDPGFVHFGFGVDDVEASHSLVTSADLTVDMEPTQLGDLKMAFYRDPTGTRFELLEES